MSSKATRLLLAALLTIGTTTVRADHGAAVLGAAIGGAAGAAVGHSIGDDRADVIIWSALGGAAGAAIGQGMDRHCERETVVYRPVHVHERYVVVPPPQRVIRIYEVPPRAEWHGHHHHHWRGDGEWRGERGWDRDWR